MSVDRHVLMSISQRCGYIGDFYQDVYLDAMCKDLQGNIEAVAGPALTVVILMFLSFCVQVRNVVTVVLGARARGTTWYVFFQFRSRRRQSDHYSGVRTARRRKPNSQVALMLDTTPSNPFDGCCYVQRICAPENRLFHKFTSRKNNPDC